MGYAQYYIGIGEVVGQIMAKADRKQCACSKIKYHEELRYLYICYIYIHNSFNTAENCVNSSSGSD